jgi:hypothetical protein
MRKSSRMKTSERVRPGSLPEGPFDPMASPAIENDQMIAGRWLRIHLGRKLYRQITETLSAGLRVQISTYTKSTLYSEKHLPMFRLAANGDVFVQRGSRWELVNFSRINFAWPG